MRDPSPYSQGLYTDALSVPPPPNPATFHHVDVPIIERNYSSEDDSNVIRNPSFTADGQPSWLTPMNVDQTPAYTPVENPLSVPYVLRYYAS